MSPSHFTAKRITVLARSVTSFRAFSSSFGPYRVTTGKWGKGSNRDGTLDPSISGMDLEKSIYTILTIDRWKSLNLMRYRLAKLRPVHGRLALKFFNWVKKQPGLELNHLMHIMSITTHILVRARMYSSARSILRQLLVTNTESKSVFDALMETYRLCGSNPAVFDILIRVYLREGMMEDAIDSFYMMDFRGFKASVCTCNGILAALAKDRRDVAIWSFFGDMLEKKICPDVATFNVLINFLCSEGNFTKAGHLLKKMEESGYVPTVVTYNTLLNWYCKMGRYKPALQLIEDMCSKGLKADIHTYNTLVNDLCRNNMSSKGYLLLRKMRASPNEVTYNTVIHGFVREGKVGIAKRVFDEMVSLKLQPNCITYSALIDGLCQKGSFEESMTILDQMEEQGLKPNEICYGSLLNGLSKHGKLSMARRCFERMRNGGMYVGHIAYTMLIDGYCKKRLLDEAIDLFTKMTRDGVNPDIVTYSVLVNGFCTESKINSAKELICKMYKSGLVPNGIIYATLIHNFCKQGKVMEALRLYTVMESNKYAADIISCNTLVNSLCRDGNLEDAELFMHHMRRIGVNPDAVTFDCLINSYASTGNGLKVFSLFEEMIGSGHSPTLFTYASLLKGLCRERNIVEATKFFSHLRSIFAVDIFLYNILLDAMCKAGKLVEALDLVEEMVDDGMQPNSYSYVSLVHGLCKKDRIVPAIFIFEKVKYANKFIYTCLIDGLFKAGYPKVASFFYLQWVKSGGQPDIHLVNAMLDGYSRRGMLRDSRNCLSLMSSNLSPNLVTYNILLHWYSKKGDIFSYLSTYKDMIKNGFKPDRYSCHSLIHVVCESGLLNIGMNVMSKMLYQGVMPNQYTIDMLLKNCCERGKMKLALDLFNTMILLGCDSEASYKIMIDGFNKRSLFSDSRKVMHKMLKQGYSSELKQYITLMNGLCRVENLKAAFDLKEEMVAIGVSPMVVESAMVRGLALCRKSEKAVLVLNRMLKGGLFPTLATFTTVIHMFCKDSNFEEALKLKSIMELCGVEPDVVTYNVLIAKHCEDGDVSAAVGLYDEMKAKGLWANLTTYSLLIEAITVCKSHVAEGDMILMDLRERGVLPPKSTEECSESVLILAAQRIKMIKNRKGK